MGVVRGTGSREGKLPEILKLNSTASISQYTRRGGRTGGRAGGEEQWAGNPYHTHCYWYNTSVKYAAESARSLIHVVQWVVVESWEQENRTRCCYDSGGAARLVLLLSVATL